MGMPTTAHTRLAWDIGEVRHRAEDWPFAPGRPHGCVTAFHEQMWDVLSGITRMADQGAGASRAMELHELVVAAFMAPDKTVVLRSRLAEVAAYAVQWMGECPRIEEG